MLIPQRAWLSGRLQTPPGQLCSIPSLPEASFSEGELSPSHPGCSPLALVPGAVSAAAPGSCARVASPEPGQLLLHWETEKVLNNGGLRINPHWSPRNSWLSGGVVLAAGLGALQCLDFQSSNSARSLQAAGVAKSLTQGTDISTVTSVTDGDNPQNSDMPRSLFHNMVLIDTNDNSPFQTFITQIWPGPFQPSAQD